MSYNRAALSVPAPAIGEFVALLPLFPLDVVLLPGTPLPLHIFEPRYKEMISECRANDAPFGVVRALDDGVAEVGCTAEIVSVTKEYSDGRLDLVAEGRNRFEVLELNRERSFLQAEILLVPDEPGPPTEEVRREPSSFTWKFFRWLERCRICLRPIRTRFLFISLDLCLSIWISNRSC
jgi:Lon protease-like protein